MLLLDKTLRYIVCALLLGFLPAANAVVLVDQRLLTAGNIGYESNTGSNESADNFSLTDTYNLTTLTWYGMYFSPVDNTVSDDFTISIFDTSSTLLAQQVFPSVARTDTLLLDDFGGSIYEYSVSFSPLIELAAGDYLLSITNVNSDFTDWYWADSDIADSTSYYRNFSEVWIQEDTSVSQAFILSGDLVESPPTPVPAPATLALLVIGLGAIRFSRSSISR